MNPLIILFAIFLLSIVSFIYHLKYRKKFKGLPSPRSYPILGHATIVRPDEVGRLDQIMGMGYLYCDYPRMVVLWLGPVPVVMIYSAEIIESIFTGGKHLQKGKLYDLLEPWLGLALLTSPPSKWKPRRKLLTPTFHYDILKQFVYVFNFQAEILVNNLKKLSNEKKDDCIVNIGHYITLCALDIICETSMGQSVNAQHCSNSEYVKAVHEINDIIQKRQLNPLMWNNILFKLFGDGIAHDKDIKILHDFRSNVIKNRREQIKLEGGLNVNQKCNFLDLLLEMETNGDLSLKDIENEVDTFMFEGHDTTATSLTWVLQLLGTHHDVQERIREEIHTVVGYDISEVTYEQLGQLKYTECCIKEALRLFPSVPMFVRRLDHDEVYGEYCIPGGTEIIINSYMTHRDPKYWPEPEKFRPERFMPPESNNRHPYAYIPFSIGNRNCIGQRFALLEEKTVLVYLLSNFKFTSTKRMDQIRCKSELILRPLEPIMLKLECLL
uniref:Cytochrome P450 4c3 n=1 Tax=Parastrongyloides trichosuri TaxID=131310 RepID=A0A0N4Z6Q8_PARTI